MLVDGQVVKEDLVTLNVGAYDSIAPPLYAEQLVNDEEVISRVELPAAAKIAPPYQSTEQLVKEEVVISSTPLSSRRIAPPA